MPEAAALMEEEKEKSLKCEGIRGSLEELHHRAASMISFMLQWKDVEDHLEFAHNAMEARANELRALRDGVKEKTQVAEKEERFKEIEAAEKTFKEEIEERRREIEWIEKKGRELEAVRVMIEEMRKEVEVKEKGIGLKEKELELKEKEIEARRREIELKEKEIEEKEKKFRRKEMEFKSVMIEVLDDDECDMKYLDDASIRFCVKMDGKDLQIFLNERWDQHGLMKNEVDIALKLSPDPAKLVLDAMQGFYPPYLKKGDVEFEESVVRSSCNLLLEQLRKMSPPIKPHVRKGAMKLAFDWMTKMRKDSEHSLEVLGFLRLLATYGLASAFDADELLSYLKILAQHSQAPELARVLGLACTYSGKDLQIFLNERWKEHDSMRNEVEIMLLLSSDPAKLVLDAMQGFYSPHLKKGDVEFEEGAVRSSCSLLLEQLMKMSPPIAQHVKKQAMKIALDWVMKMRKDAVGSLEVLAFLQLLASYHLASAFDGDELLNFLEIVAQHSHVSELAHVLGVEDKFSGNDLQIFLNERWKQHHLMKKEVETRLGLSPNPAKLVLDAIQGFYPPYLKKGDVEFEEGAVRSSCNLLLGQLMKISPPIKPNVRKEAMKLAFDWMEKMRTDAEHRSEVLGFLRLLATYGLASAFDADQLLNGLKIVAHDGQAPQLARGLGLVDKISGIVQNLLGKNRKKAAMKFIYQFELVNDFPDVSILREYLKCSGRHCKNFRERNNSLEADIEATQKRINDLRAIVRCIENHKIECESEISSEKLKLLVDFLEKENAERKVMLPVLGCMAQPLHLNENKCFPPNNVDAAASVPAVKSASSTSPTVASFSAAASNNVPTPKTPLQQQSRIKRPLTAAEEDANTNIGASVVASINLTDQQSASLCGSQVSCTAPCDIENGEYFLRDSPFERANVIPPPHLQHKPAYFSLKMLLDKHENYELLRNKVFDALQHAYYPAKLVLDVIQNVYPSNLNFKLDVSKEKHILLLEELRRVSPKIPPRLKNKAMKFANCWKSKFAEQAKDPLEVVCFLQFLAAYELASSFNANELLGLLDTDHWRKKAPDLCQILGLVEVIPDFIQNLLKMKKQIEAIKYIYSLNMVGKFPPAALLNDYLSQCSKQSAKKLSKKKTLGVQIGAIEREVSALKAVAKCIADYKIESEFSIEILEERIMKLEKEKFEKLLISKNSKTKIGPCSESESQLPDHLREKKDDASTVCATNITTVPTISSLVVPAYTTVTSSSSTSATASASISTTQPEKQSGNKRPGIVVSSNGSPKASVTATSLASGRITTTQPGQQSGNKRPKIVVSSNASKKASVVTTSMSSTSIIMTQPEQLSGNKHPRIAVSSSAPPKVSIGTTSMVSASIFMTQLEQQSGNTGSSMVSASIYTTQPELQSGNTHPWIPVSTYAPPKASLGATSIVDSMQPPNQCPAGWFMNQGAMGASSGHYSLSGYPPNNVQLNSYYANVVPHCHWNTFGNPGWTSS